MESPRIILGHLVFIICVNDYSPRINSVSEPVFAGDTSVIISSRNFEENYAVLGYYTVCSDNFEDYCSLSDLVLSHIIKWLAVNNF
jgi:hypothetical protein